MEGLTERPLAQQPKCAGSDSHLLRGYGSTIPRLIAIVTACVRSLAASFETIFFCMTFKRFFRYRKVARNVCKPISSRAYPTTSARLWVNATTPDLREEQRFGCYPDSVVPGPVAQVCTSHVSAQLSPSELLVRDSERFSQMSSLRRRFSIRCRNLPSFRFRK